MTASLTQSASPGGVLTLPAPGQDVLLPVLTHASQPSTQVLLSPFQR